MSEYCVNCERTAQERDKWKAAAERRRTALLLIANSDETDLGEYAKFAQLVAAEAAKEVAE